MQVLILLAFCSLAFVAWFLYKRWVLSRAERLFRVPLTLALDAFIAELQNYEDDLDDLHIYEDRHVLGHVLHRRYFVYPVDGSFLAFSRMTVRKEVRYVVDRWTLAVADPPFPPYDCVCRSPWFVERMQKLLGQLELYPRSRLRSMQVKKVLDDRLGTGLT